VLVCCAGWRFHSCKRESKNITRQHSYINLGKGMCGSGGLGLMRDLRWPANGLAVPSLCQPPTGYRFGDDNLVMFDAWWVEKISAIGACIGPSLDWWRLTPAAGLVMSVKVCSSALAAAIVSNLAVYYRQKTSLDEYARCFPMSWTGGNCRDDYDGIFAKDVGLVNGKFETSNLICSPW